MRTVTKKMYEGMFLIDSARAASDWEGVNKEIRGILEKAEAEIVSLQKWDERKLAYEIKGKDRGVYILVYFKLDGGKLQGVERAVQLSDKIMRVLILNVDDKRPDYFEKETPITKLKKAEQQEQTATIETEQSGDEHKDPEETEETVVTVETIVDDLEEIEKDDLQDEKNG